MKRLLAVLVLFVPFSALADDKDKLHGKWMGKAGPEDSVVLNLNFDKDKSTIEISFTTAMGDEKKISGVYAITPTAKPQPTMSWTKMKVDDRDLPDKLSIYQVSDDGKTLKIASQADGQAPSEFVEKLGATKGNTLVFTKVTDDKK